MEMDELIVQVNVLQIQYITELLDDLVVLSAQLSQHQVDLLQLDGTLIQAHIPVNGMKILPKM